jgi:hypothetical protein
MPRLEQTADDEWVDDEGYPTDAALARMRRWAYDAGYLSLLGFVQSCWWAAGWGWSEPRRYHYSISTGGWSGNEDIIDALESNHQFWTQCFKSERIGGHYRLYVPKHLRIYEPAQAADAVARGSREGWSSSGGKDVD